MSLPLRERGLKSGREESYSSNPSPSLPLRERGLKSAAVLPVLRPAPVAPLAGAWIEIDQVRLGNMTQKVAPLAGAWIEINYI